MKIISFIDQPEVIKAILQHVGLWETQKRPPPKTKLPPSIYYTSSHIPSYVRIVIIFHFWVGCIYTCLSHSKPPPIAILMIEIFYFYFSVQRRIEFLKKFRELSLMRRFGAGACYFGAQGLSLSVFRAMLACPSGDRRRGRPVPAPRAFACLAPATPLRFGRQATFISDRSAPASGSGKTALPLPVCACLLSCPADLPHPSACAPLDPCLAAACAGGSGSWCGWCYALAVLLRPAADHGFAELPSGSVSFFL